MNQIGQAAGFALVEFGSTLSGKGCLGEGRGCSRSRSLGRERRSTGHHHLSRRRRAVGARPLVRESSSRSSRGGCGIDIFRVAGDVSCLSLLGERGRCVCGSACAGPSGSFGAVSGRGGTCRPRPASRSRQGVGVGHAFSLELIPTSPPKHK